MSTQWNQQLSRYVLSKVTECLEQSVQNKLITKDHRMQNEWTEYKIFELKYGNRKLSNIWKYNQVRLILAFFYFYFFVTSRH